MSTPAKKQHYIPQFLLRNFRIAGEEMLWVFDKSRAVAYKSSIRDVASESYFNDVRVGDLSVSFEPRLERVEAAAAPVISQIIKAESVANLTPDDQAAIVVFLAVQLIRGKATRVTMKQSYALLCEKLGGVENAIAAGVPEPGDETDKLAQLLHFPEHVVEFAPALINKIWMLQRSRATQPFLIGDEPIVRQNTAPTRDYMGNLGIACEGIEIYLPLTPHLMLTLLCPSLQKVMELSARHASSNAIAFDAARFLDAIHRGRPYLLAPDNVKRLNALQAVHATRFLMSSNGDFSLIRKMIATDIKLKETPTYVR